jgi:hypothetical protein
MNIIDIEIIFIDITQLLQNQHSEEADNVSDSASDGTFDNPFSLQSNFLAISFDSVALI